MGFAMNCDRCGRFMKNVPVGQLRAIKDGEIVCNRCEKIEIAAKKKIDRILKEAQGEMHRTVIGYKNLVTEAVQESVREEADE